MYLITLPLVIVLIFCLAYSVHCRILTKRKSRQIIENALKRESARAHTRATNQDHIDELEDRDITIDINNAIKATTIPVTHIDRADIVPEDFRHYIKNLIKSHNSKKDK